MGICRASSQTPRARAGLQRMDVNTANNQQEDPISGIRKIESRTSLSGRISRLSMKEFDVGLAVARQFGPVNKQAANNGRYEIESGGESAAFL